MPWLTPRDRREIADYDIEKEISKEAAEGTVRDAERFLERIKKAAVKWKRNNPGAPPVSSQRRPSSLSSSPHGIHHGKGCS
jgi:Tfp pilus assembly protein PilX